MNFEAPVDTPVLRLFREHQSILQQAREHVSTATGKEQEDELDRLFYQRSDKVEAEMMALPCTCPADFAAKVIVDTVNGGLFSDWKVGTIWKEARDLVGMPLLGLVENDHEASQARLKKFAIWTGTTAPESLLDEDGAPTDELLDYCAKEGLSLDWLFLGDERALVLGLRKQAA